MGGLVAFGELPVQFPAEAVVAGRHPVVDVSGEEVEPVAVLAVGQQRCLVVQKLLDLVLELETYPGQRRHFDRHRATSRFSRAASISDQLSQVIMSSQR
jgi:hypothetical protein